MAYEYADKVLKYLLDFGATTKDECAAKLHIDVYHVEIGINDIKERLPGFIEQRRTDKSGGFDFWINELFKDEAVRVLQSGGIHNYTLSKIAEKEKKAYMEKLDIESKVTAIETAKQSVRLSRWAIGISIAGTLVALAALIFG